MNWYKIILCLNNQNYFEQTYEINIDFLPDLNKKMEKLQRKAISLNLPPIEYFISQPCVINIVSAEPEKTPIKIATKSERLSHLNHSMSKVNKSTFTLFYSHLFFKPLSFLLRKFN